MWYVDVFDILFLKEKDHLHGVRVSYLWVVGKTDLATLTYQEAQHDSIPCLTFFLLVAGFCLA